MQKLKNIIIGFIKQDHQEDVINSMEKISLEPDRWHLLSKRQAKKDFVAKKGESSLFEMLMGQIDRHIGGGPSEFLRDIDEMDDDEMLFVANVKKLREDVKIKIIKLMKSANLRQAKYFGDYGVEHITLEVGHDKEMPMVTEEQEARG